MKTDNNGMFLPHAAIIQPKNVEGKDVLYFSFYGPEGADGERETVWFKLVLGVIPPPLAQKIEMKGTDYYRQQREARHEPENPQ